MSCPDLQMPLGNNVCGILTEMKKPTENADEVG